MITKLQPLVYIIDSNSSYRKVIQGCLDTIGITNVELFDNGEQCYTAEVEPADIIILDYSLGKENWNGTEFMKEYSALNSSTQFIFLSSHTGVDIAVDSIRKGAVDYILKSKSGLIRLVKQVEGIKHYIKKEHREKLARHMIVGAIIAFSTLTALISILYSTF